jgi:hypothetical protein
VTTNQPESRIVKPCISAAPGTLPPAAGCVARRAVVGLLTDRSQIPAISAELRSTGVDIAAVEILCGEQGARILDKDGRYHGLRGRVVRTLQRLGYDQETLEIYDEALSDGDLVLQVPARPQDSRRIATLLQRHEVHDVGYFGPGTFEQLPILDTG